MLRFLFILVCFLMSSTSFATSLKVVKLDSIAKERTFQEYNQITDFDESKLYYLTSDSKGHYLIPASNTGEVYMAPSDPSDGEYFWLIVFFFGLCLFYLLTFIIV